MGAISDRAEYAKMVQLRNFIVQRYERIDVSILADMLAKRLDDFETFRKDVLHYAKRCD